MLCTSAQISILHAAGSLKEAKHLVVQPELPSALGFLAHDCTWQLQDTQPRWPMFSQAEGAACTWVLSLLGIFCLAVEICSWCGTGLRCSPKHAVWWYHMLHHSQTLTHVLQAITSRLLPPQCLPQWPGHHSSHWATTLPHKSSSESCAFKHCIYEHTCKVNKYA